MNIPYDWLPTADNVNALPDPVRRYIMELETHADPAGTVAENTLLSDQTRELDAMIARLKSAINKACDVYTSPTDDVAQDARKMYDIIGEFATDDPPEFRQLTDAHLNSMRAAFTIMNRFAQNKEQKLFVDPIAVIADVYYILAQAWTKTLAENPDG